MQRGGALASGRVEGPAGRRAGASCLGGEYTGAIGNLLSTKPGRRLFAVSPNSQSRRAESLFGDTNVLISR